MGEIPEPQNRLLAAIQERKNEISKSLQESGYGNDGKPMQVLTQKHRMNLASAATLAQRYERWVRVYEPVSRGEYRGVLRMITDELERVQKAISDERGMLWRTEAGRKFKKAGEDISSAKQIIDKLPPTPANSIDIDWLNGKILEWQPAVDSFNETLKQNPNLLFFREERDNLLNMQGLVNQLMPQGST